MSLLIYGHHTDCAACSRHLPMPRCPLWILSKMLPLSDQGITIRSPLTKMPFHTLSSPLTAYRSLASILTFCLLIGHPLMVSFIAVLRVTSFCVSFLILSSLASDTGQDDVTLLTCTATSSSSWFLFCIGRGLRDNTSATCIFLPGM